MKRIILKPGEEGRILAGHPWVYDNEVWQVLDAGQGIPRQAEARKGDARQADLSALVPGDLAELETLYHGKPRYLGRAFVNPHSKIVARIYSPSKEGVDKGFFKRRIREAIGRRLLRGGADEGSYNLARESARLVFAEADFLPGLIIDRYVGWALAEIEERVPERPLDYDDTEARLGPPGSWISVQFLSCAMDRRREEIIAALEETLAAPLSPVAAKALGAPLGIVERSPARIRELEGLPPREGLVRGFFPPGGLVIFENGLPFVVCPEDGQKTGHFLDQRDNRLRAAACAGELGYADGYADGYAGEGGRATGIGEAASAAPESPLRVLDGCCYTGGFAIHILRLGDYGFNAGASPLRVDCVDSSAAALETLRVNAALNGVEQGLSCVEADIFEFLRRAERQGERYDLVILDPPAFAKTRSALADAIRGYKEINLRALKLLRHGGILLSCSCSQALDRPRFRRLMAEAARDAERRLYLLESRSQASDHPVLVGYDESEYLCCDIYRVV
ncbi:MAG: class I SAM-dependent rRNA methyltransferase [Treponema sp.]|nr:class I SAM-dependent rRNA methyltransferase [Treponema sp.]